eukprot:c13432_g1_i1.p1 GENE.c13432_g1_i1~~c13432_g1_i1.p1  ORF type:complete len:564 (+),score=226.28 c13432_g1_i1:30-1721(+)
MESDTVKQNGGGKGVVVESKSIPVKNGEDKSEASLMKRSLIFGLLLALDILVNYDAGAIPGCLDSITIDGKPLDYSYQGSLSGAVYLGLAIGSPLCGILLHRYSPRKVLFWNLIVNTAACYAFTFAEQFWSLLVPRFIVGFSQAALVVYAPVWVDSFAPTHSMGKWMSVVQTAAPLGVVVGYLVTGAMTAEGIHWRWPFILQATLMLPLILILGLSDDRIISSNSPWALRGGQEARNLNHSVPDLTQSNQYQELNEEQEEVAAQEKPKRERSQSNEHKSSIHRQSSWDSKEKGETFGEIEMKQVKIRRLQSEPFMEKKKRSMSREFEISEFVDSLTERRRSASVDSRSVSVPEAMLTLLKTRKYIGVVLALTFLFFVVTALQTYTTQYLTDEVKISKRLAVVSFGVISITGAIVGCVFGGVVIDKLGGYEEHYQTTKFCTFCCIFAFIFSLPTGFFPIYWVICVTLWFMLFFGGALIPAANGVLVSCVPFQFRSLALSLSMTIYTLLGYASAPFFIGLAMDATSLVWGFRIISFSGIFGVFCWLWVLHGLRNTKRKEIGETRR